jgi:hypothetical protein
MASEDQKCLWGEQLAAALPSNCATLKHYISTGLTGDCGILIAQAAADPAQRVALTVFCEVLECSLTYLQRSWESEKLELTVKQDEVDALRDELARKTTLNETALAALAAGGSSNGRRLTKDLPPFSSTEEHIAKRQEEYVN